MNHPLNLHFIAQTIHDRIAATRWQRENRCQHFFEWLCEIYFDVSHESAASAEKGDR
jgi:hypothetical protein